MRKMFLEKYWSTAGSNQQRLDQRPSVIPTDLWYFIQVKGYNLIYFKRVFFRWG